MCFKDVHTVNFLLPRRHGYQGFLRKPRHTYSFLVIAKENILILYIVLTLRDALPLFKDAGESQEIKHKTQSMRSPHQSPVGYLLILLW